MNFNKMLKQAQKMQADAAKMQADLAAKTFTASVGGGKVTVTATGAGDVVSIKISRDVVDPDDVEMLEDLVLSGVKQAIDEGKKRRSPRWASLPPAWAAWGCPVWVSSVGSLGPTAWSTAPGRTATRLYAL